MARSTLKKYVRTTKQVSWTTNSHFSLEHNTTRSHREESVDIQQTQTKHTTSFHHRICVQQGQLPVFTGNLLVFVRNQSNCIDSSDLQWQRYFSDGIFAMRACTSFQFGARKQQTEQHIASNLISVCVCVCVGLHA